MIASTSAQFRRLGLLAIVGGIIGLAYAPFYASAFFATPNGAESAEPAWVQAWHEPFRDTMEPLLTFASPHTVYVTWGKALSLVMVGWIAGLVGLHSWQRADGRRLERAAFRLALVATSLFAVASLPLYWMPQPYWDAYVDYFFMGLAVPGFLLTMIAFPLYGWATIRARVVPRAVGWLLALGAFPGIILLTMLTGSLTGGLLVLNAAWIVTGVALRRHAEQQAVGGASSAATSAEGS